MSYFYLDFSQLSVSSENLRYIESCNLEFDNGSSKVLGTKQPNSTEEILIIPKGEHISIMQGYRYSGPFFASEEIIGHSEAFRDPKFLTFTTNQGTVC